MLLAAEPREELLLFEVGLDGGDVRRGPYAEGEVVRDNLFFPFDGTTAHPAVLGLNDPHREISAAVARVIRLLHESGKAESAQESVVEP